MTSKDPRRRAWLQEAPRRGRTFEEEFFIVPVPLPLPVPDLPLEEPTSDTDSAGHGQTFRRLLFDPFSGTGTGTGTRNTAERQSVMASTAVGRGFIDTWTKSGNRAASR